MATRTCLLLSALVGLLAASSGVIRPLIDPPRDSVFASEAAKIKKYLGQLSLAQLVSPVYVKYGSMERLGASGFWNLQKALHVMDQQTKARVSGQISNEIAYLKSIAASANPPIIVSKRSAHFPMDFGDHKLVFLVSDIIVPDGK